MALRLSALLAALAAAVAGCGSSTEGVDTEQIKSVVLQFAAADDAHACELLSPREVVNLYGNFTKSVPEAKAACRRRSKDFEGEQVTIKNLNVIDQNRARVSAENPAKTVTYGVSLRRYGPSWRIESISQAKLDE